MIQEPWSESYPLTTLKGETRKEFIAFISTLISSERENMNQRAITKVKALPVINPDNSKELLISRNQTLSALNEL